MSNTIHIGIAEDHLLVRQGLVALLKNYDDINVLFDVSNGKEVMNELKYSKPDIILLDIEMPVMNGRETLEKITVKYPKIKTIIISMHFQDAYIVEFIKKGAGGFLPKNCDIDKIVGTIRSVYTTGFHFDEKVSSIMKKIINPSEETTPVSLPGYDLTEREIAVLKFICINKSNKDMSDLLGVSIRTIEGHRLHLIKKTGCKTTTDLTAFALRNNIISVS